MRKFVLCLGVAALLAGCQTGSSPYAEASRRMNEASVKSKQMEAQCYADKDQFRTMFSFQQCLNAADGVLAATMIGPPGVSMSTVHDTMFAVGDAV